MFQASSGKNRKSFDNSTQAFAQDQALKVRNNGFPFVVVWVGKPFKRQLGWKETIFW
jgi:hypothetical protein